MTSTTIIMILAIAVAVLAAVQKNEAIVSEIHRSQNIIERAVKHGVSRAALL